MEGEEQIKKIKNWDPCPHQGLLGWLWSRQIRTKISQLLALAGLIPGPSPCSLHLYEKKLQAKPLEKWARNSAMWIMLDPDPRTPKCSLNFTHTASCPQFLPLEYKPGLFRKLEKVSYSPYPQILRSTINYKYTPVQPPKHLPTNQNLSFL